MALETPSAASPVAETIVNACTILHNMHVQAYLSEPEIEEHIDDFGVYDLQPVN